MKLPNFPATDDSNESSTMEPDLALTDWQKKQATLLYHFSSAAYLKEMRTLVDELIKFVQEILDHAKKEERDKCLVDVRWGERDTSANWATNAWPFLKTLQISLSRQLADHAIGKFYVTGMNQCARGIAEFSMDWATSDEKSQFDDMLAKLSIHATRIDKTVNKHSQASQWTDFALTCEWKNFEATFAKFPRFRLNTDFTVNTGDIPSKTGVYVPLNESDGSLQFAWKNGPYGKILLGKKFNDLGTLALNQVGRRHLWIDEHRMLDFVIANRKNSSLVGDSFYQESFSSPLAPSLVARNAFITFNDRWALIEVIKDEFEEIVLSDRKQSDHVRTRIVGGQVCTEPGFYITQACDQVRQYFYIDDIIPICDNDFGFTMWQLDENQ